MDWRKEPAIISLLLFCVLACSSCTDTRPFLRYRDPVLRGNPTGRPDGADVLTFYVLGDWGTGNANQQAVADALSKNLRTVPPGRQVRPFVLELGDNAYQHGLATGWDNPEVVERLRATFGDVYSEVKYQDKDVTFHVVAGNHDHAGKAGGKKAHGDVIHQETTAERIYPNWEYYPIDPARNSDTDDQKNYDDLLNENILDVTIPQVISIDGGDKLLDVFAIDSQVFLDLYDRKETALISKHWQHLQQLVSRSTAPWKMLIGHHPVKSHGKHGGFRKAFWWIPPMVLATLVDKFFYKRIQDLDNPAYGRFRKEMTAFMQRNKIPFYLAGHEHNLQMIEIEPDHYQVVSGSAGKLSAVSHGDDSFFSQTAFGFARFDMTETEVWIEFLKVATESGEMSSSGLFKVAMPEGSK